MKTKLTKRRAPSQATYTAQASHKGQVIATGKGYSQQDALTAVRSIVDNMWPRPSVAIEVREEA